MLLVFSSVGEGVGETDHLKGNANNSYKNTYFFARQNHIL